MSTGCHAPLGWELLVEYWAGELAPDDEARVEEHLFACGACTRESERVAAVSEAVRHAPPPTVTPETLAALRARGLRIRENPVAPESVSRAHLGFDLDLMIHVLGDLDLARSTRVGIELRDEHNDQVLMAFDDVAFDRDGNRVLLVCHPHYVAFPPDLVIAVKATGEDGGQRVTRYTIRHVFGGADPGPG